ncbi:phosphoglycerate kinase [Candidatus Woesearchaeota archaeon]|nr:phosphoglycerate kinase [Candidatus Woesearchaeota archaeon]
MKFLTLKDMALENKRVLVRVDYNVPLKNGIVADDTRLEATVPTINYLLEKNCKIILMSHLGRPKDEYEKGKSVEDVKRELSLNPVAENLSGILGIDVVFAGDCVDIRLPDADIILLENLRFHDEEEKNNEAFAQKLASLADVYVNDAFGASHRKHASVHAITNFLPSCAGFLLEKEINELSKLLNPEKPFVAIIGGAKADKIGVMRALLSKVDSLIIGGVLANTFLKAKGVDIRKSKFDEESLQHAKEFIGNKKILLPVDVIVADRFEENADSKEVSINKIPNDWMVMDIGSNTIEAYKEKLSHAKTVLWAGPLGVFEFKKFSSGTRKIAEFISSLYAATIIGGGDSAAAVEKFGFAEKMTHVSTGGGASLEFIEKDGKLPAIVALEEAHGRFKK